MGHSDISNITHDHELQSQIETLMQSRKRKWNLADSTNNEHGFVSFSGTGYGFITPHPHTHTPQPHTNTA
jgi:hypothetical protein